jgi:hypothetical protein
VSPGCQIDGKARHEWLDEEIEMEFGDTGTLHDVIAPPGFQGLEPDPAEEAARNLDWEIDTDHGHPYHALMKNSRIWLLVLICSLTISRMVSGYMVGPALTLDQLAEEADVIFKGDHVFNSSKEDKEKKLKDAARTAEITTLLYSAGKFREYKERKKMEVRVDRLGISSDKEEKPEVFVDMVETGEYTGEGEFKILGNKIEEYQRSRESVQDELHPDLLEITSIDSDLNFIEDDKEVFETPKLGIKLVEAKRHVKLEVPAKAVKELVKVDEELEDRSSKRLPEQDAEVTSPKKSKLKFGFKDGE